jgi:hypothetical protein
VHQGEERLYFLRHICKGRCNACLWLIGCLGTVAALEFVLAGGNEECCSERKPRSFNSSLHSVSQLHGRVSKTSFKPLLVNKLAPLLVVPLRCQKPFHLVSRQEQEAKELKKEKAPRGGPSPLCSNTRQNKNPSPSSGARHRREHHQKDQSRAGQDGADQTRIHPAQEKRKGLICKAIYGTYHQSW